MISFKELAEKTPTYCGFDILDLKKLNEQQNKDLIWLEERALKQLMSNTKK